MSDGPISSFLETIGEFLVKAVSAFVPEDLKLGIPIVLTTLVLGSYIMILQLLGPYVERKVMARQQGRKGPYYVGRRGVLQIPADLGKLLFKEDTRPENADWFGFFMSIYLIGLTSIMSFAPLPFSRTLIGGNMSIGVLYVFAIFSIFPPAMFIGGWASNSKYALIGGFRSAGQLLAYEIPMFLSILGVIGIVGSFSLIEITEYQITNGWFMFSIFGLIAAWIFYISGLAETERIPFDIPEAEAELVMGPRTEFSGWRYAIIMMVEYVHLTVNSLLFVYIFFGGYDFWPFGSWDPFPGIDLMALRNNEIVQAATITVKFFLFVFFATTVRTAFPRMRIDQLLSFGWKQLLPLSLVALLGMLWTGGVFA
ncbi:MAG: NADH-quinone oxidoreductase subunit H [Methanobacteriota archaeon]|nr:MAG: NADH-quinone oxidoreductase subunit H [Euryarchaeota archaeon]